MAEAGVVRGVVALELAGGQPPARDALGPEPGGELATRVGRDLARLVDTVADLDLDEARNAWTEGLVEAMR